mmetsp:Transcript_9099/g.25003  ORF Transcript_9099/g.25003 Transcript_9099/m.25003 type:complete len:200 (-) Transcript_9099:172-771(-)
MCSRRCSCGQLGSTRTSATPCRRSSTTPSTRRCSCRTMARGYQWRPSPWCRTCIGASCSWSVRSSSTLRLSTGSARAPETASASWTSRRRSGSCSAPTRPLPLATRMASTAACTAWRAPRRAERLRARSRAWPRRPPRAARAPAERPAGAPRIATVRRQMSWQRCWGARYGRCAARLGRGAGHKVLARALARERDPCGE